MEIKLRKLQECINNGDFEGTRNCVNEYAKKLIERGWLDVPIEGIVVSPDYSTCFFYNRAPYDGQLATYTNKEDVTSKFQTILETLRYDFIVDGIVENDNTKTINNVQKVVLKEDVKPKGSFKLTEEVQRLSDVELTRQQMEQRLLVFVENNKDNEILKQYLEMKKVYDKAEKDLKEGKDLLYTLMIEEDVDNMNTGIIEVNLTKPYIKKSVSMKKLVDIYGEDSNVYKDIVEEKEVKGHITIKPIKE